MFIFGGPFTGDCKIFGLEARVERSRSVHEKLLQRNIKNVKYLLEIMGVGQVFVRSNTANGWKRYSRRQYSAANHRGSLEVLDYTKRSPPHAGRGRTVAFKCFDDIRPGSPAVYFVRSI